jgi:AbrB family looped-hinge helix DNA binding protein
MPFAILNGMKNPVTLDKTGRMVLPLQLRNPFGLGTGAELELHVKSDEIALRPVARKPTMTKESRLYVHEGIPDGSLLDPVDTDRRERDRKEWDTSR